ncbi:MAG: hypothetical protein IJ629_06115 [Clostridia bacterium]|nr:hypothetical protein [Clostridia bacterium]
MKIIFYAYEYINSDKKQRWIRINIENKSFLTDEIYKRETKFTISCYGFGCYELKDYRELEDLQRFLVKRGFQQEEVVEESD